MQNNKADNTKNKGNKILWIIAVVILIFVLIVIPHFLDIKTKETIIKDLAEVESLLDTYLENNRKISEGLRTDIDVETKLISGQIYDSKGIVESMNLNKDYYRIPGLINVLVNTNLEGNFICDEEGNVYYIHNRPL